MSGHPVLFSKGNVESKDDTYLTLSPKEGQKPWVESPFMGMCFPINFPINCQFPIWCSCIQNETEHRRQCGGLSSNPASVSNSYPWAKNLISQSSSYSNLHDKGTRLGMTLNPPTSPVIFQEDVLLFIFIFKLFSTKYLKVHFKLSHVKY